MSIEEGKKLLEKKEYEEALAIFEEHMENKLIIKTLNTWAEDVNSLGDALYKKKNYSEALSYYEQSIQIMERTGNVRRVENFTKELLKTTERLAQQINEEADGLLRSKKYAEAVELYFKSVELMSKVGTNRKIDNFKDELRTALTKLAEFLLKQAETAIKQGNDVEALDYIDEAITRVNMTYDTIVIKNVEEKSQRVYERIADTVNSKGDAAFRNKEWSKAIELYNQSIRLIKKSKNEKKLAKFQNELKKSFSQNAAEINKEGDRLYKAGEYEKSIEIYRQSIEAAEESGDQKQADNYRAELENAFEKYAQSINKIGDDYFKQKKFEEAAHNYIRSIQLAQDANNDKLVKNFTDELRSTYENWSKILQDEAEALIKKNNWSQAIDKLKQAIEKMEITGDDRKVKKAKDKMIECYEKNAEMMNNEGDIAYKMKDYEKAYNLYEQSVSLAQLAQNPKLLKRFRKERDRTMRKI